MPLSLPLLIVDNDPHLSAEAAHHLSIAGYEVHCANSGNQGLTMADECSPVLIILNPELPDMSHQDFVREVRSSPRFKHIAILHWGGTEDPLDSDEHSSNPLARSVEDWLERPTPPRRIPVRVRTLLRQVDLTEGLRSLEARAATVFRSSPVAIAITTVKEGRFIEVNDRYCELLGYSREELMQQTVPGLKLWAKPEDRAPALEKLLKGPNLLEVETRFRRKDLELLDVIISLSLVELAGEPEPVLLAQFSDVTERRAAERSAKENRDFLRMASRISRVGAWRVELPERNVTWSEEVCAIHDVPAGSSPTLDEAIRYIVPEYQEPLRKAFDQCCREGTPLDVEFVIETATNKRIWVRSLGEAIRDSDGHIVGIQGAIQDINDSKEIENSLAASNQRFLLLSKATNDAIWDWDLTTDLVWWNEGFEALFGYRREDLEPSSVSWTARIHPEDLDTVVGDVRSVIRSSEKSHYSGEYRFRKADGSYAHVLDRGHIIRDNAGNAIRMIGGMTDLTERVHAQERLEEQATLLDQANDAILVRTLDHKITFWNKSAERLYGWTSAEALNQSAQDLLHRDPAGFTKAAETTLASGEWCGELFQFDRHGKELCIEGRWTLVRDHAGNPKSILAINTDMTDRRRLESQFLRAQRMESIGTLAGGIAHDLNNVLAPILLCIDLLKSTSTDADSLEALHTIEKSAQRGAGMVGQVLSFARGMGGQRIDVRLGDTIQDLAKIVRDTFPKNIRIDINVAADLWNLQADPTQIHQVLLNLCVNARDAMPDGGILSITAENAELDAQYAAMNLDARVGPHIRLEVEDTGTGMQRDILDKIFDPFFTTKDIGKGTGLGLATTMAIVKGHGGFIRAYSEYRRGSRFRIYLPANQTTSTPQDTPKSAVLPRGKGQTILVVDDEESIRHITRQTLEAYGYKVLLAADGSAAVSIYARNQSTIALVLTDMVMPVMDGPTTIQVLRRLNPTVPIIAASGIGFNERVAQVSSDSVRKFLPKPYTADTLLRTLHEVLNEPTSP